MTTMTMTTTHVDPAATTGRWLVTTGSGARHLVESTPGPLWTITVTRVSTDTRTSAEGFRLTGLRRDGEPLRVLSIRHIHAGVSHGGIRVGQDMHLVIEPLDPEAMLTLRRSTPVVSIQELPASGLDG